VNSFPSIYEKEKLKNGYGTAKEGERGKETLKGLWRKGGRSQPELSGALKGRKKGALFFGGNVQGQILLQCLNEGRKKRRAFINVA